MRIKCKTAIEAAVFTIFIAHCAAIFLSNLPASPLKEIIFSHFEGTYADGIFKQNWSFFAPIPKQSNDIAIQCSKDGLQWTPPRSPFREFLKDFHSNPLSSNERIFLMLKDINDETIEQLRNYLESGKTFNAEMLSNSQRLKILALGVCRSKPWVRFYVESTPVVSFSKRESLRKSKFMDNTRRSISFPVRLSDATR